MSYDGSAMVIDVGGGRSAVGGTAPRTIRSKPVLRCKHCAHTAQTRAESASRESNRSATPGLKPAL